MGELIFDIKTKEEILNSVDSNFDLNQIKNFYLLSLTDYISNHIENYYSTLKQKSDIVDKEYYQNYLMFVGIDEILFRKELLASVINIYNSSSLQNEVNRIMITLNIANTTENFVAIEQLLKVSVRITFVQKCKEVYRQIKQTIENATTIEELPDLSSIQLPQMPVL